MYNIIYQLYVHTHNMYVHTHKMFIYYTNINFINMLFEKLYSA